jgi:hypothetical protein
MKTAGGEEVERNVLRRMRMSEGVCGFIALRTRAHGDDPFSLMRCLISCQCGGFIPNQRCDAITS